MLLPCLLLALCAWCIYIWLTWHFNYWPQRHVRAAAPMPLVGSFPCLLTQQRHFADELNAIYRTYCNTEHYVGIYLLRVPQLLLLQPALIREVFVTSFRHFHDNDVCQLVDHDKDPLIACNPFILAGQQWREQRALITPGLTGARIKVAYDIVRDVCRKMCAYVQQLNADGIDASDLALRFTAESVSASVLGIEAYSFAGATTATTTTPPRLPIAAKMCQFSQNNVNFLLYNAMVGLFPSIWQWYRPKFVPQDTEDFFTTLMRRAFNMRREQTTPRADFLDHLMALQRQRGISDDEMASHAWTFLIDGLDTTATAIAHCLLLLARNPSAQRQLHDELSVQMPADDDAPLPTFEALNELPYLDACVHESLRLFPPGLWSTKLCTAPHTFTNRDGRQLSLNIGDTIVIPVYSVHMDAANYAQPERYMPERFMPPAGGVRLYRERGVYLAFGDGPRTCMGMRYALMQVKSAVAALVHRYHVRVNAKTLPRNQLDPRYFVAMQKGGIHLDFVRR